MRPSEPPQSPRYIHAFCGPRTVSTSLMYSFHQRDDISHCLDEPLYASFLTKTGADRPYKSLVLESQDSDGDRLISSWLASSSSSSDNKTVYVKHMSKHLAGLAPSTVQALLSDPHSASFLLVRDPYSVLRSFSKVLPPTLEETCFPSLLQIFSESRRLTGRAPPVVLSQDLTSNPEGTLRALCKELRIAFDPAMLQWEAGPKPAIDGVWAPWWYGATHRSTGFGGPKDAEPRRSDSDAAPEPLSPALFSLLEECLPIYELLKAKAITPLSAAQVQSASDAQLTESVFSPLTMPATHSANKQFPADPRNEAILIGIRDGARGPDSPLELVPRGLARTHVLEAAFVLGDGMWEGLRVHRGRVLFLEDHLDRLWEGMRAMDLTLDLDQGGLTALLYKTLSANGMSSASSVHVRLMISRGRKPTPHQDPYITMGVPTIVIVPEYKAAPPPRTQGIKLFTCAIARGPPNVQDPRWNSHSKLNCIAACIQAHHAGADEALMLDPQGFVSTCNSTNFFIVRKGVVMTPPDSYQMNGITRAKVVEICRREGIPVKDETLISLTQCYSADEAFVTGTGGGLTAVGWLDGRVIGDGAIGPMTKRLQALYQDEKDRYATSARHGGK